MDWRTLLIVLIKGALQVWADMVDPEGAKDYDPKEAPEARQAESPPQAQPPATPSEGWGPPSEQAPVTVIRIETDAGSTVAAASFVGDECFGVTKVERARQPGESRRVRRKAKAPPVEQAPRDPRAAAFLARANARIERQQEAMRAAVAIGATRVSVVESTPPMKSMPRARPRGDVLPISSLSPATLLLLEVGEPTTCVRQAA